MINKDYSLVLFCKKKLSPSENCHPLFKLLMLEVYRRLLLGRHLVLVRHIIQGTLTEGEGAVQLISSVR
jgi:hypothetical protein